MNASLSRPFATAWPTMTRRSLSALLLCASALHGCANLGTGSVQDQTIAAATPGGRVPGPPGVATPEAARQPAQATQVPAPQELQGQLSIKLQAFGKVPAKGLSLGFFFSGNPHSGQLDLITLMGSQLAQVNWAPGEVWLTDDKGRHRYESMEHLSQAVLGEALPLGALVHWMQGRPDPAWPSAPGPQPESFAQLGWIVDQSDLGSKKLTANRASNGLQRGVSVKVYLDR
jgi:outer membrane lipoprotein LolB